MKNTGFTLVELMIVIAIASVLVALAIPSYQDSVRKSRRAEAQKDLMEFAGMAERIFNQDNSYAAVALPDGDKDGDGADDFYTYSFVVDPADTPTRYTIQAAPTTVQADDVCNTMRLTHSGERINVDEAAACDWK